jgi:Ser/Thr protein kinase RdoA (MazF antagonist)
MTDERIADEWRDDAVATRDGRVIPVRATARRPTWSDLAEPVRSAIIEQAGSDVVLATSVGTGFTPGFASRLDLADGRRVFVKAASEVDDARVGWTLSESYREEARKLHALPSEIPAPTLLWHLDTDLAGYRCVVLCFVYVDGAPPRRPWRTDELTLVLDALAALAPVLAAPPPGLRLSKFLDDFGGIDDWLTRVHERDGGSHWLDRVTDLARLSLTRCQGSAVVHLDLRDDNILIGPAGRVWICDWNWPLIGAPWLDVVTVLIAANGDGLDADALVASHPLTRDVDPQSIDAWLANLWLYFTTAMERPESAHSPHLRAHQTWYAEATESWLRRRLGGV